MSIVITLSMIISSIFLADWKRIKEYYPTFLYITLGNHMYYYLTKGERLWEFNSPILTHRLIELLYLVIILPLIAFIFLSQYNEAHWFRYHVIWICLFSMIEYIQFLTNNITYNHGWNIWWSILFYSIMFPMLRLHYKLPFLTLLLSTIPTLFFLWQFGFFSDVLQSK